MHNLMVWGFADTRSRTTSFRVSSLLTIIYYLCKWNLYLKTTITLQEPYRSTYDYSWWNSLWIAASVRQTAFPSPGPGSYNHISLNITIAKTHFDVERNSGGNWNPTGLEFWLPYFYHSAYYFHLLSLLFLFANFSQQPVPAECRWYERSHRFSTQ